MQRHNKHREAKGNLKRSASPTSDASQSSIGSEVSSTGSEADMTDSDTKLKEHIGDQQSILSWFSVENFQSEEVDLPTAASLVTILEDSGSKAASPSGDTTENKPRYPIIGNHSVTGASHSELDAKSLHHSPTTMDPSVLPSHGNNNNLDSLLSVLDIDSEQSEPSFFAFTSHTPVPSSLPWDSSLLQTNNSVGGHDRPDHPHPPLRRDPASDGSPDSSGKQ